MVIFMQGDCKAWPDVGRFRRLAFQLALLGFTEPQNLEGLFSEAFPFILEVHDRSAMARTLAASNSMVLEIRTREEAVRATEFRMSRSSMNVANALHDTQELDKD